MVPLVQDIPTQEEAGCQPSQHSLVVVRSLMWVFLVFDISLDIELSRFTILLLFYQATMCRLSATSKFDVRKIPVPGQLEHRCQSGKGIDHLILLSKNKVKGYVIKVLYQFSDVGLVGYQLMILGLSFSSQLVDYQG